MLDGVSAIIEIDIMEVITPVGPAPGAALAAASALRGRTGRPSLGITINCPKSTVEALPPNYCCRQRDLKWGRSRRRWPSAGAISMNATGIWNRRTRNRLADGMRAD